MALGIPWVGAQTYRIAPLMTWIAHPGPVRRYRVPATMEKVLPTAGKSSSLRAWRR
jgi:hypothetical protein